ncbi:hypothetical protein LTR46_003964 [Exophiala xenobiotica]|nr:hypothetical protein LTR46_003964 [Exophiala xenobiotica]
MFNRAAPFISSFAALLLSGRWDRMQRPLLSLSQRACFELMSLWPPSEAAHLSQGDLNELIDLFDLYGLSSEEDLKLIKLPRGLRHQIVEQEVVNAYKAWRQRDLFSHEPLEHTDSLRLARVMKRGFPKKGPGARFELEVRHFRLSERPPFSALSYCWGKEGNEKVTFVNGQKYWVRSNLAAFLEQSASSAMTDWVWIDAICIDQKSPGERTHQVNLMGQIYTEANLVRVWLGTGSRYINHFLALVFNQKLEQDRLILRSASAQQMSDELLLGFMEFLDLNATDIEYWQRTWVVQEILLARDIRLHYGIYSFPWATIPALMTSDSDPFRKALETCVGFVEEAWSRSRYFWFNKGRSIAAAGIGTFSLQELIESNKRTRCSDPRDKIYGMLGLVHKHSSLGRFAADYTISAEVLLLRILRYDPSISILTLFSILRIGKRSLTFLMALVIMPELGRSSETLGDVRIRPAAFLGNFTRICDRTCGWTCYGRESPRLFDLSSQGIPGPAQSLADEGHLKCVTPFNAQPQDMAYEFIGNPCEAMGTLVLIARPGKEDHLPVCVGIMVRTDQQGWKGLIKKRHQIFYDLGYRFEDLEKCGGLVKELLLDESRIASFQ